MRNKVVLKINMLELCENAWVSMATSNVILKNECRPTKSIISLQLLI